MIAKALGAGGGWSGKVEYLYEGKLEERQATDKRAEVILHSENVRVPYDHTDKAGRQRMKADFIAQAQSHKWASKKDKTIGEHVLSFTPEDMRTLRNKEGMRQVASEYVKLLGLDKTQHVAILHQDTDNPHLHIVFNRVTNEGKKYKDSHERRRALAAAVVLSQKHGLHLVGDLKPAAADHRTKAMRADMEDLKTLRAERPILSEARNLRHLGKLAEKQGLTMEEKGNRITLDKQEYKLCDLDAMFQANRNATSLTKVALPQPSLPAEKPARDGYAEHMQEVRRDVPILQTATSFAEVERMATQQGIAYEQDQEWGTTIGERTVSNRMVEEILVRNAAEQKAAVQTPGQPEEIAQQMIAVEARLNAKMAELRAVGERLAGLEAELAHEQQPLAQSAPELEKSQSIQNEKMTPEEIPKLPILNHAVSRWHLEELARKDEIEYLEHPDQGISLVEHTISAQALDVQLEANRANYERKRYEEIRQSLGEIGQARSRAEMAHLAKVGKQTLTFGRQTVLQDKQGQARHYDAQDVDAVLGQNLKTSATPAYALLNGKGVNMTNLGHVKIVAKKTMVSLSVDEESITTVDRKGNVKTFDKKEVLDMLAVNQAKKIANLRAEFSFLNEVESFREFEELAQEKKQAYQAVQASDAAEALRSGQQAIKAGKVAIKKGMEKMEEAEEMVAFGEITGRQGQRLIREGKNQEGQLRADLGRYSMVTGAKQAQEAEQAITQGAEAIKVGVDVVERVNLLGKEALENYLQSPGQIIPGLRPPEQAIKSEAVPPPTTRGKLTGLLKKITSKKEAVKEEGETDYIISGRTRYVQLGNQQLHRSDLRQIIAENKIEREKKFDQVHQSQRLLRESTDFGDLHRRAERLEMKVETKGRWVEIEGQKGLTRVRKSDLDEMLFLNRTNHKGREHDHRHGQTVLATGEYEYRYAEKQREVLKKAGVEYNKDGTISFSKDSPEYLQQQKDQRSALDRGYVGRMVSKEQDLALENRREYKGNRRRQGGRRTPDHQQKIGKLKLSTDKSKKMRL